MEHVGYHLLKVGSKKVIEQWGGVSGQCPAIPNMISLPNGDHVHAPKVDEEYSGYVLKKWMMKEAPEPTIEEKLARVGITIEELKTLLNK